MSPWGWGLERNLGIWRYGAGWMRPILAAIPYLTVGLLLLMLYFVSGTLTASQGVLFDLPDGGLADGENPGLVVLVMPVHHETMVFFDESRYLLDDASSMRSFDENLTARLERSERKSLLVLADRRIPVDRLMSLMTAAKRCGVERVMLAGKRAGSGE